MDDKLARINTHVRKHKTVYIVLGVTIGVGAIAAGSYILGTKAAKEVVNDVTAKQTALIAYKSPQTMEIYIEALGDPGNIIQDLTTGTVYASQNQAARALGVSATTLANHLKGDKGLIDGHQLVKLGKAHIPSFAE